VHENSRRMDEPLASMLTALADDELILGHRHSEWTGFAPHIEEDVAFSSIAQDEIGHAAALYSLLAELGGPDPDSLALGREPDEYRNAVLCERANRDWSYTLARHWLYDKADDVRLEALQDTAHEGLASLVAKMRREERYHLLHADIWMRRIARGPAEGRARLTDALSDAFDDAVMLFEPFDNEEEALERRWLPVSSEKLRERWLEAVTPALEELGLPSDPYARREQATEFIASSSGDLIARESSSGDRSRHREGQSGRRGLHSPDLEELWSDMTATYRADPEATW
jgi:ring-1,2-phenylacetyl-CoA epoxidase subunit PaaC